jgi:hypothetical protein
VTKLEKAIRRELTIKEVVYTLVIDKVGLTLKQKGHRTGTELTWADVTSGDAALSRALQASLHK